MSQEPENPMAADPDGNAGEAGEATEATAGDPALAKLEASLRAFRTDRRPAPDWQARVLASVRAEAPPARRSWRSRWMLPALPMLACAAALAIVYWPTGAAPLLLAMQVTPQGGATRGHEPQAGDRLTLSVRHRAGHRALWIYRGRSELVLACPGAPACQTAADELSADLVLPRVGEYTVVALWSATEIAAPAGTRDDALAAATRAGMTQQVKTLSVH